MPQLQSIDEVVELREHRDVRRGTQSTRIDAQRMPRSRLRIPSDGMEPDSTGGDDVATNEANEEWVYEEEEQVVEQATAESQYWCMHKMHDGRQGGLL